MHRTDGDAQYPAGHFSEGDPLVPRLPSQVTAAWLDNVQEELATLVTTAGLALIKGTAQLQSVLANLGVAQTFTALKTFSAGIIASVSASAVAVSGTNTRADASDGVGLAGYCNGTGTGGRVGTYGEGAKIGVKGVSTVYGGSGMEGNAHVDGGIGVLGQATNDGVGVRGAGGGNSTGLVGTSAAGSACTLLGNATRAPLNLGITTAPSTGVVGDVYCTATAIHVCTVSGTPGTWLSAALA